ncbi:MAG: SDR family oxidoreductase [Paracoccaceae bacterium]
MDSTAHTLPDQPSDILILGASRGIGAAAVEVALARGHAVRAFARSPEALKIEDTRLTRYAGDARSPDALRPAVAGADAVIYALGTPGTARGPFGPRVTLHSEATRALIDVMREAGVRRLVAVTGYGAGESRLAMSLLERTAHRAALGRPYADKDRQEALIRGSGLDWTIVRPTILRDAKARGRYEVLRDASEWRNGLISRADVADFLVRRAEDREMLREAPVLAW